MKYVSYMRVSTDRQGKSGLGLEAQRAAIAAHLHDVQPVGEFVEVETGRRKDRPQLDAAMIACRRRKATLIIAKLDRLTRSAHFLLTIVESNVPVVFCDLPHIPTGPVGKFLLTQMAAVAELEAGLISARTKAALAAAKARGTRLGSPRPEAGSAAGSALGAAACVAQARKRAAEVLPEITAIRSGGVITLLGIAAELNARGIASARGGEWSASTVTRVLNRAG